MRDPITDPRVGDIWFDQRYARFFAIIGVTPRMLVTFNQRQGPFTFMREDWEKGNGHVGFGFVDGGETTSLPPGLMVEPKDWDTHFLPRSESAEYQATCRWLDDQLNRLFEQQRVERFWCEAAKEGEVVDVIPEG